ncbi:MAG: zinc ribbon domain-containing protein [Acidimicrobiia bacterium]|nr:zinc ribbon domain-containing protein [Acidimicrobiia bacterium]
MPLYEYRCRSCDTVFEERRPMAASNEPATCPQGHPDARRVLSVFMTGATRSPGASPAPVMAGGGGGCCGGSCGCG